MAFCRKLCCCDFSEEKPASTSNANNLTEMRSMDYAPTSPRLNRASSQLLADPLISPMATHITSSPGMNDLMQPGSPAGSPGGAGGDLSPRKKRSVTWAPKGYEQPKTPGSPGPVRGIYKQQSSFGAGGGLGPGVQSLAMSGALTPYSSGNGGAAFSPDATGGREPPDLSLL